MTAFSPSISIQESTSAPGAGCRILLINPPHIPFTNFVNPEFNAKTVRKKDGKLYGNVLTDMPLGLLSLSSYLKKYTSKHVNIDLIDFNVELNSIGEFPYSSFKDFFYRTLEHRVEIPDIVAISALFSTSYRSLLEMGACARSLWPECIIVTGGPVPSGMYREIYRDSEDFNGLCHGEGEKAFLGLIESQDRYAFMETSHTWITKPKLEAGVEFKHDFVENLDDIPFYDYDLCDAEKYGLNPAITAYHGVREKEMNFHFITSLGCPFHCTFCSSHRVHGRKMRYWSIERVKEDLIRLKQKFGAKTVIVQDDHFMGDPERALQIVKIIGGLGMKAVFQNGLAMYALKREFLEALKDAGVEQLLLSIESGNENTLKKLMKKPLKLAIVERVVQDCRDLGIYTNCNILIGMPGETKEDIEITREFLKTISPNWFMIFCASPLVGSEMYETAVANNYLKEGFIGSDFKKAVIETEDFTADYIQQIAYFLNLELNFVLNSDMRLGSYELALRGIENAIRARDDHAIAYYYAAECLFRIGDIRKAKSYLQRAKTIVSESAFWRDIFEKFEIEFESEVTTEESGEPKRLDRSTSKARLESIFGYSRS